MLLDKSSFPREKICAGAIGARADRLLDQIGVRVEVPSIPVTGLRVTARVGEINARLPDRAPIGRVVRRIEYDAVLLDQVRSRGIKVCDGVAVKGVTRGHDHVALDTSAGPLRARAVVGADGVGSLVRRSAGFSRGDYHAQAVEVDTPWLADDVPDDLLCFDITDRDLVGYVWDFPTIVNGQPMVCRGVYQLTRGAPAENRGADISARLRSRLAEQGIEHDKLRFKRFAERGLALQSPTGRERVLLVGEAAGIDPVLGEGIAQAIFYGKTAGEYLVGCARRNDYSFADWARTVRRSRVGLDLSVRALAVPLIYGRTRRISERWVTRSHALADAGLSYFGGRPVAGRSLAGALLDFGRAVVA